MSEQLDTREQVKRMHCAVQAFFTRSVEAESNEEDWPQAKINQLDQALGLCRQTVESFPNVNNQGELDGSTAFRKAQEALRGADGERDDLVAGVAGLTYVFHKEILPTIEETILAEETTAAEQEFSRTEGADLMGIHRKYSRQTQHRLGTVIADYSAVMGWVLMNDNNLAQEPHPVSEPEK